MNRSVIHLYIQILNEFYIAGTILGLLASMFSFTLKHLKIRTLIYFNIFYAKIPRPEVLPSFQKEKKNLYIFKMHCFYQM